MSGASTEKPTEDPWRIPAQGPARAPATKSAAQAGRTKAQQARLLRLEQSRALMAARVTWPIAYRFTLAGAICRVLAAVGLIGAGVECAHLHGLFVSTTTVDQWNAAARTANALYPLDFLILAAMIVPGQAWARTRVYVAKLPGAAPHPLQSSKELYRAMRMPAYWPPVPEGVPSWTRRLPWRVPPAVTGAFVVLLVSGSLIERSVLTAPGRYAFASGLDFVAAALALVGAVLDVVRLRAYRNWPGRS
jgi:hypothetical protein